MSGLSAELSAIVDLQRRDTALADSRRRHSEIPRRRQTLAAARDEARAAAGRVRHDLEGCRLERRRLEKETEIFQAEVARLERQLFDVKTNEEYKAMQHQIAAVKTKRSDHETAILELMEREESLGGSLKSAEMEASSADRTFTEGNASLDSENAALESEIADRERDRDASRQPIAAPLLAKYDRLLHAREGVAVVAVTKGACGACHRALTPHDMQVVKQGAEIHACEGCGRLLVSHEPAAE